MGRGWQNLGSYDRKKLDCLEQTVGRNRDVEDSTREGSRGSKVHGGESLHYLRVHTYRHKRKVGRNMNVRGLAGENSEGNGEHAIGT